MQSGALGTSDSCGARRSLLPSPPPLQGGLSRICLRGASQGQAAECFEQQECDRATPKESLVAQTTQLVLSHAAAEMDPLLFWQTPLFVWLLAR